eukprot:CAMPEP_0113948704 /NCGR_PEP_ID=MMETSP1339-20121228/71591_1 /TAXON_ID=94617 /ORGANISM="Fibrocapsa japonica" /LENGTH=76 /DNA_ID=CAMNT_0000955845 /DNA_START=305 /DNA_END=531 /DNA_ORIENTATION=+ /assembly_acc=CAM_ASM_000762
MPSSIEENPPPPVPSQHLKGGVGDGAGEDNELGDDGGPAVVLAPGARHPGRGQDAGHLLGAEVAHILQVPDDFVGV